MRLGIFGGTFNPIHYGHLLLAETAREALALDRVLFVPTRQPPHKTARGLLAGGVRLAMIEAAIRDQPAFAASDIELQRSEVSYSIETVRVLHQQLPMAKLFLLVGQDMLAVKWVAWKDITALCTIVAARRPGATAANPRGRGVKWLEMPQMDIASSDIRARLKAGRSIRYLVPPAVERYIRQHGLYAGGSTANPKGGPV